MSKGFVYHSSNFPDENIYNATQFLLYPTLYHYTMELTVVNDLGQTFIIEVDPNMELENVMALLEAEVRQMATWPVFRR